MSYCSLSYLNSTPHALLICPWPVCTDSSEFINLSFFKCTIQFFFYRQSVYDINNFNESLNHLEYMLVLFFKVTLKFSLFLEGKMKIEVYSLILLLLNLSIGFSCNILNYFNSLKLHPKYHCVYLSSKYTD